MDIGVDTCFAILANFQFSRNVLTIMEIESIIELELRDVGPLDKTYLN